MPGEFDAVTKYLNKIDTQVSSSAALRRLQDAGTKAAVDAARRVGRGHALRNWHGSRLDAIEGREGAELTGPWRLFEQGRRSRGEINARRGGAVSTPDGPRASSSYGPSAGLGVYRDASSAAQQTVPKAIHEEFEAEVRRVVK